ncbi:alpha/beta hydrolase [Rarobacter incanus]|uniref:Putative membrane protein n=1 Tax=Rarobacter incanus TaxID=153494 RepID=A0A542SMY0_9MICO|nr:alpha/beta-hydrolase family protein [Rarobacter incanus]TQK75986.1 putative membrane protein [Rarobacter incanus]
MTPSPQTASPAPGARLRIRYFEYLHRLSVTGLVFAALAGLWSFTPSLLPRTWWVQGLVTGLAAITAYGIGTLSVWVVRGFDIRDRLDRPRARRVAFRTVAAGLPVLLIPVLILSLTWQIRQRELLSMPAVSTLGVIAYFASVLIVPAVFVPVLGLARAIRRWSVRLGHYFRRALPARLATVTAAIVVASLTYGVISGVLVRSIVRGLDGSFQAAAHLVDPGLTAPTSALKSGGPDSVVNWSDLGREGRRFVTRGPSSADIASFEQERTAPAAAASVSEPIRAYAGLTDSIDSAAALVVAELDRTKAWDRAAILVVTTTGSGWIDESLVSSFEYLHAGNTATAAMQYSYLPSWMAFLGDRETPPEASSALFSAIWERWSQLPESTRPRLYVAGLSLGSYGMQAAFSSVDDLVARTDGAVFAGTPYFVPMWKDLTAERDPGTTQAEPIVDGGTRVRFYTGDADQLAGTWHSPRIAYLQHGTDGTTWWSPSIMFTEPAWMNEPRAPGVMPQTRWFPVASFWQVAFDLFFAAGSDVPMGAGHHFQLEYVDAFAKVCQPAGWTDADSTLLRRHIGAEPTTVSES